MAETVEGGAGARTLGAPAVPSAADPDTSAWWVEWVDRFGAEKKSSLVLARDVPFDQTIPSRRPPSFQGQRSKPGLFWSTTQRRHLLYESRVEMAVLLELDADSTVLSLATQPLRLRWRALNGRWRRYTPDVAVAGTAYRELLEIKPTFDPDVALEQNEGSARETHERNLQREQWEAMNAAASVLGWTFRVTTPPGPQRYANLTWLTGFRHVKWTRTDIAGVADCFADRLDAPIALRELVGAVGPPWYARPIVFSLIWNGILEMDLDQKWTNNTSVRLGPLAWPKEDHTARVQTRRKTAESNAHGRPLEVNP